MSTIRRAPAAAISLLLSILFTFQSHAQWVQTNCPGGGTVQSLLVSGTNLFAGTGGGVFLSTDEGATWTAVNSGLTHAVNAFAISGTNIFAGTGGGVFRSTNNGTSWDSVNTGLRFRSIQSLAVADTDLLAGTSGDPLGDPTGGIFRSTNNGAMWTNISPPLSNTHIPAIAVIGTDLFFGSIYGAVFRSTNNGSSWKGASISPNEPVRFLVVSGTNLFVGVSGDVFLSTDYGTSWTQVGSGLGSQISALAVWSDQSDTDLIAGAWGGGIFLSTDKGTHWTAVNAGMPNADVVTLAVSATNLFAGTSGSGVWRRPISGVLPIQLASFTATKYSSGSMRLAWTTASEINNYGFYVQKSRDKRNWENVGELIHGHGTTLEPQRYTVTLPIANGSWWVRLVQVDLDGTSTTYDAQLIQIDSPVQFELEQNYPNPFNPSTTIRYGLPAKSQVTLTVFNTLGQQVATLVDETQDIGYHDVRFNGASLASGVYFYRLRAGDFVSTKATLLVK
jgi:hypothetical protein